MNDGPSDSSWHFLISLKHISVAKIEFVPEGIPHLKSTN
jgi:hypothetical protein